MWFFLATFMMNIVHRTPRGVALESLVRGWCV